NAVLNISRCQYCWHPVSQVHRRRASLVVLCVCARVASRVVRPREPRPLAKEELQPVCQVLCHVYACFDRPCVANATVEPTHLSAAYGLANPIGLNVNERLLV